MFEQSAIYPIAQTRRVWTVLVSFAGQMAAVVLGVLTPLVFTDRLPLMSMEQPRIGVPRGPVREPGRPPEHVKIVGVIRTATGGRRLLEPAGIPRTISTAPEAVEAPPFVAGATGEPGGGSLDVIGGIVAEAQNVFRPAPAPPTPVEPAIAPPRPKSPERIRLGGEVQAAKLIHQVIPAYPRLAVQAHISGNVQLQAIIGADGRVRELRVASGPALLIQAAVDAVRQWVYQPTFLNGDPVEVLTTIDVNFTLGTPFDRTRN